jgi:ATP-binding cassette subfamily B protein
MDGIAAPKWAAADQAVAEASWWQTVRSVPAAVATVTRLAWQASRGMTVLTAVLHVLSGCVMAFGLLATADVLGQLLEQGPTPQRVLASLPAIALVAGAYSLGAVLSAGVGLVTGMLTPRVEMAARDQMYQATLAVDAAAFDDADFRELVRQGGERGTHSIRSSTLGVGDLLSSVVSLVASLATVAVFSGWLLPALLVAAAANAWAAMRAAKLNYESFLHMVTRDRQSWVIGDLITQRDAALEVRAFTTQPVLLTEYRRIADILATESIRVARRQTFVQLVGRAMSGVGTALAYVVLGWLLYVEAMPLALAGAAVVAMRTGTTALRNTIYQVNRLYEQSFHIDLFGKLLVDARTRRGPEPVTDAPVNPATIELRDVSYTYPGQDSPALQGITLKVRRGEVIALVGENGSGKSTLGKLITGLYRPSEGQVLWDGTDIATAHRDTVHGQISVITQEPLKWPVTAADNIRIGRLEADSRDGALWTAHAATSGADEVIEELPRKENTILSRLYEEGKDLSGGQWQRLSVARGAYRNATLLVADEPTAALDAKAEAKVFTALQTAARDHKGDRTTVLVTHRLANVRQADRIIVLEQGRITEDGTHDELMTHGGLYAELYSLQASAYQ